MTNPIEQFAKDFNVDVNAVNSLADYIIERVGDKITDENVSDVVEAMTPMWNRAQENMATEMLTKIKQSSAIIKGMIEAA